MLQRSAFFAASMRLVVGVLMLLTFSRVYPDLDSVRGVMLGYVGLAVVAQVLVYFQIGGMVRPVVLGIIDVTVVTVLLHLAGPTEVIISAYYLIAILNALVVTPAFGMTMAGAASMLYGFIMAAEAARWPPLWVLPERWQGTAPMPNNEAFFSWVFVSVTLAAATLVVVRLVRRIEGHEQHLQSLSQHDALTGLFNRRHLLTVLERELARVQRGQPLSLVMLDLDGFKRINDVHGHERGDALLLQLSEVLRQTTRSVDVPGRWGGDEFVVLLPDTTVESAEIVASRLAFKIREAGTVFDPDLPVTASVGLAQAKPGDTPRDLLARADTLAYESKRAGGDRVSVVPAN
jgi:diguanylate cyclase (GGDEF)-like protein